MTAYFCCRVFCYKGFISYVKQLWVISPRGAFSSVLIPRLDYNSWPPDGAVWHDHLGHGPGSVTSGKHCHRQQRYPQTEAPIKTFTRADAPFWDTEIPGGVCARCSIDDTGAVSRLYWLEILSWRREGGRRLPVPRAGLFVHLVSQRLFESRLPKSNRAFPFTKSRLIQVMSLVKV